MSARDERPEHGVARIQDHAVLGPLPVTELIEFTFDAIPVTVARGEPIAVALLAAGYRVFRAMPERGDERGGYCFVGRCTDCQVIVNGIPGIRSCVTPVTAGMKVQSQQGLGPGDKNSLEENGR